MGRYDACIGLDDVGEPLERAYASPEPRPVAIVDGRPALAGDYAAGGQDTESADMWW